MKRNQIIAISACVALLIVIYFFGNRVKPKDENAAGPMSQGHAQPQAQQAEALNIEEYIALVNEQITDKATQKRILDLTEAHGYKALIGEYQKLDKPLAIAYYTVKVAETENSAATWLNSGDYNSMLMQTAPDEKSRKFLAENAINCYEKAIGFDTANTDYKIRLAGAYMEEGSQPMQGVMLLLGIVQKDSNNVDAQMMLGRFGLVSGQIDKAIARFQKILYLQPQNTEALYWLAQAYDTQGNKQKALEVLEKCKNSTTDPKVKKEIDKLIENLKKPKS
jgi:tetratricopeptide (TPR) repeat protein